MCFGSFLVLNDSTSWIAQTVTLGSEGGANETYPDSMGEYQLAGEIRRSLAVYNWYRHEDKKDSFLMYNNIGNFKNILEKKYLLIYLQIIVSTSPTPHTNYAENVEEAIRSAPSGRAGFTLSCSGSMFKSTSPSALQSGE